MSEDHDEMEINPWPICILVSILLWLGTFAILTYWLG